MPKHLPPDDGVHDEVDIADDEVHTGLLGSSASRERLFEDMAIAHDQDAKRLPSWRRQVARWLSVALLAMQPAMRRLHWLRAEEYLSSLEARERDQLAAWLDAKHREIAEYEAALGTLTEEIAQHHDAAKRLRIQKGEPTDQDRDKAPKEPEEPEEPGRP